MNKKLTTVNGVIDFMSMSFTEYEWNNNCDHVKAANNGNYPDFWFEEIILSGMHDMVIQPRCK